MDVEGETTSNPVCKGKFSKNVTRTDCCCTGVGVAYGSECRLCPKRKTSKSQPKNSPYWSWYIFLWYKLGELSCISWQFLSLEPLYLHGPHTWLCFKTANGKLALIRTSAERAIVTIERANIADSSHALNFLISFWRILLYISLPIKEHARGYFNCRDFPLAKKWAKAT